MFKVGPSILLATLGLLCFFTQNSGAQQFIPEWVRAYPAATGFSAQGISIALIEDGIVVGGSVEDANGEPDYLAVKYAPDGNQIWTNVYGSITRKNNFFADLAIDPLGNILLTGSSDTVKLDPFGNRVWSTPIGGRSLAANSRFAYLTTGLSPGHATVQLGNDVPAPVDVILDCDPGQDPDDMSDLAIAHNLMSRGEMNLLAIMGAHTGPWITINIDVMNRYYGHTNIPVGLAKQGPSITEIYGWYMSQRYGNHVNYGYDQPEAASLYRSILASRPDRSVTIVFSGQLRNLLALWNSAPDAASPLYGPALLAKKVRQLVVIAGIFPNTFLTEYNLGSDLEAAQVINRITDPISVTYVGIEEGNLISIPAKGVELLPADNPVRYAHELVMATNRPSWTGLGLLVAARGFSRNGETYFTTVPGRALVRTNGSNGFVEDAGANQRYIRKVQSDDRYIEILEDLLLAPPPAERPAPSGDQTGHEIWKRPFNVRAWDEANFVRLNEFGEIFTGGVETRAGGFESTTARFALVKYGEAGSVRWRTGTTNTMEPGRSATELRGMAVVGESIWLFGQYGEGSALFRFSGGGKQLWHYNFPAGGRASQMVVDSNGTATVANTVGDKIVVTRISSDGSAIGEAVYELDPYEQIDLEAAALDSSGAVYFAGGLNSADKSEIFLMRFSADLGQRSITTYPSQYPGDARAKAIAVQSTGDVYLTGYMPTFEGGSELFILKLTSAFQMQKIENGPIRLRYRIGPSETLTLESTHDFSQWERVATERADERGFVQFEDTNFVNVPARFYRTKKE